MKDDTIHKNDSLQDQDATEILLESETNVEPTSEINNNQLIEQIESLKKEVAQKEDLLLRKMAEFENMRKRIERERYMAIQLVRAEALNDFLPILDDLIRVVDHADEQKVEESFLSGVRMVTDKFESVLLKNGIEKINEINVPFDVNLHEALMRQPAPDKQTPSGTVLQVFVPGYKMADRVIRHAKVIVSE